jgi:hypothetical protein
MHYHGQSHCDIMPFVIFEVLWKIPRALLYWEISEF